MIYAHGKYIVLANALSRMATQNDVHNLNSTDSDVTLHVNMVAEALLITDAKSKQIAAETVKDKSLQMVTLLNEG